jgi:hypothetical protein
MSRSKGSYDDPTTIAYICRGCDHSVASPISFHCRWRVLATSRRGDRQIQLIERWHGKIHCPDCGTNNSHVWPRKTEDLFWHNLT